MRITLTFFWFPADTYLDKNNTDFRRFFETIKTFTIRRIRVVVKYRNLQLANAKHYQTVHEQRLKWPNLWEDRIYHASVHDKVDKLVWNVPQYGRQDLIQQLIFKSEARQGPLIPIPTLTICLSMMRGTCSCHVILWHICLMPQLMGIYNLVNDSSFVNDFPYNYDLEVEKCV